MEDIIIAFNLSQELKIKLARMMKLGMTEKYLKKRSDFAYLRFVDIEKNR